MASNQSVSSRKPAMKASPASSGSDNSHVEGEAGRRDREAEPPHLHGHEQRQPEQHRTRRRPRQRDEQAAVGEAAARSRYRTCARSRSQGRPFAGMSSSGWRRLIASVSRPRPGNQRRDATFMLHAGSTRHLADCRRSRSRLLLITGCTDMDLSDFAARRAGAAARAVLRGRAARLGARGRTAGRHRPTVAGHRDRPVRRGDADAGPDRGLPVRRWSCRSVWNGASASWVTAATRRTSCGSSSRARERSAGSAFRLTYRRAVPQTDGSTATLSFDDWFIQIDKDTLMVRASIHKLMVPVRLADRAVSPGWLTSPASKGTRIGALLLSAARTPNNGATSHDHDASDQARVGRRAHGAGEDG